MPGGRVRGAEESVSRVLCPGSGRRSFIWDARCRAPLATNPRVKRSGAASSLLFGLTPGGVYLAAAVTGGTGELLPRLFTLAVRGCPRLGRCFFCGTILGIASTGRYPAPCPGELGLSSGVPRGARDRLSSSTRHLPPKDTAKTPAAQLARFLAGPVRHPPTSVLAVAPRGRGHPWRPPARNSSGPPRVVCGLPVPCRVPALRRDKGSETHPEPATK
jgi:hypothetical protein